ncbi:MAG: amidohydrolase family protein [Bdellovibrionaceae bacterium]|nr:amidohydrolase family protein [Pseudobdellovibrionaceae bacterium]
MEKLEIKNCYDSHTHFVATGQTSLGLSLQDLKSPSDIKNKIIKPEYYQGHWINGFGWDQYLWSDSALPTKEILDYIFPDTPVFLSRVDGHASWINSAAITELKKNNYDFSKDPVGGRIERDALGNPTGVLFDQAHIQALLKIPFFSDEQTISHIKESFRLFNQAGFTHIRDLSMNFHTAQILNSLQQKNEQTACIDAFITIENIDDLQRGLADFEKCKMLPNPFLRVHGLKFFVDGSLGSETAFISQPYVGTTNRGMMAWSFEDIRTAIHFCWSRKIEVAFHVIGDSSVEMVVKAAREVSASGVLGKLHLEHVQLLRPDVIHMMKPLHVHCHMQPCHWLSDKKWLKDKIGDLTKYLFQWELLRKNKIPVSFGSDSPIEPTSLIRNLAALKDTELHGIPKLNADFNSFHAHPDGAWTSSKTIFDSEKIHEVHFNGQRIV